MPLPDRPREAGRQAVASLRRSIAERIAERLRGDDDRLSQAVELGIVDRAWVEDPSSAPFSTAAPMDVVERFLERTVEQRPSLLASIGLSAIQVLSADAEADDGSAPTTDLSVVFTDLEGFTAFCGERGDDAAGRLLAAHHRAVGPVVRSRGGRVVKRLGDGLLLTFPGPEAAVLAALELLEVESGGLRLRAGIHHGPVVVQRHDVIGHVVNVAARVTEATKGGRVQVTDVVAGPARALPGVEVGRPRRRRLKGIAEAVPVTWVRRGPGGAGTPPSRPGPS